MPLRRIRNCSCLILTCIELIVGAVVCGMNGWMFTFGIVRLSIKVVVEDVLIDEDVDEVLALVLLALVLVLDVDIELEVLIEVLLEADVEEVEDDVEVVVASAGANDTPVNAYHTGTPPSVKPTVLLPGGVNAVFVSSALEAIVAVNTLPLVVWSAVNEKPLAPAYAPTANIQVLSATVLILKVLSPELDDTSVLPFEASATLPCCAPVYDALTPKA